MHQRYLIPFFAVMAWAFQVHAASGSRSYVEELIAQAHAKGLGYATQWLRLGHYRHRFFGGYESQADGPGFFLSKRGKTDPSEELDATLHAFFLPPPVTSDEQHPRCRFPARFLWLKRELAIDETRLPMADCSRYEKFREGVGARSVTVVFSSYYLNNPSSAFGHSFLRLNKAEASRAGQRYELLDYGISYAAQYVISNPLVYAVYGIFGMIPGTFSMAPYYYKVREYNDFEARDLWEYDLSLTPEQAALVAAHIWELGSTYFDYYYLTENCSYHVLSILEVADSKLDLLDRLPAIVIPADTMRVVMASPGLVTRIQYRPSIRARLNARVALLSASQKDELRSIIQARSASRLTAESLALLAEGSPASVTFGRAPNPATAGALDAAIDYVDASYPKDVPSPGSAAFAWKRELHLARASLAMPSPDIDVPAPRPEMPHLGHDSARTGLEYGSADETGRFASANLRLALHDHLDPSPGYPDYAAIDFLLTRLRYNFEPKSVWLDDFALIRAVSLPVVSEISHPLSWKASAGARTIRDLSCRDCLAGSLLAGAGYTWGLGRALSVTGMLELESNQSPSFDRFFLRAGIGPSVAARAAISSMVHGRVYASYKQQFPTGHPRAYEIGAEARAAVAKDFAMNARVARFPAAIGWEYAGGALYYF